MVLFRSFLVFAAATGINIVRAQNQTAQNSSSLDTELCNEAVAFVDSAVAWGVGGRLPDPSGNSTADYQWLYAVTQKGLSRTFLLSQPGVPFPENSTATDYCMLSLELPLNNLLLAQTDDGFCNQTFGTECVQSMVAAASQSIASSSKSKLPGRTLCASAATAVSQVFGSGASCKSHNPAGASVGLFIGYTPGGIFCNTTSSTLLPGYGVSGLSGLDNEALTLRQYYSDSYSGAYRTVRGQMIIPFHPNGSDSAPQPTGYMACPHVTNTTAGATVPSALPSGTTSAASTFRQTAMENGLLGALLVSTFVWFL